MESQYIFYEIAFHPISSLHFQNYYQDFMNKGIEDYINSNCTAISREKIENKLKGYPSLIDAYIQFYNANDVFLSCGENVENEFVEIYAVVNREKLKWFFVYLSKPL